MKPLKVKNSGMPMTEIGLRNPNGAKPEPSAKCAYATVAAATKRNPVSAGISGAFPMVSDSRAAVTQVQPNADVRSTALSTDGAGAKSCAERARRTTRGGSESGATFCLPTNWRRVQNQNMPRGG